MAQGLSKLLLDLYRGSRRIEPEAFQEWMFETLGQVFPIDGGTWISGVQKDNHPPMHSYYIYRYPEELIADYMGIWQHDPLHHVLEASSGVTFNFTTENYLNAPVAQAFMRKYDVGAVMATRLVDPISNLRTVVTVSRAYGRKPFVEQERQFMESLMPHLIEVWISNRLTFALKRNDATRLPAMATATGVADSHAMLHLAEDYFTELLCLEWPDWHGPQLPDALKKQLLDQQGQTFVGQKIVISGLGKMHDQFLLRARRKGVCDSLGEREREIARLVTEGLSQKEIARNCGISPATVNNHLAKIYQKLNIGDKAQLAKMMSQLE